MERRGREAVRRSDVAVAGIAVERSADMRYVGPRLTQVDAS
jgi:hypothetical protein